MGVSKKAWLSHLAETTGFMMRKIKLLICLLQRLDFKIRRGGIKLWIKLPLLGGMGRWRWCFLRVSLGMDRGVFFGVESIRRIRYWRLCQN